MRITSKGQVTIPCDLREIYGLFPHSEVEIVGSKDGVLIKKKEKDQRGNRLIEHMARTATTKFSTDEIMRLTRGDHD